MAGGENRFGTLVLQEQPQWSDAQHYQFIEGWCKS